MTALVGWYKKNAWLPVLASMLLWVATSFMNLGGDSAAVLSLAATVAIAVALGLLAAAKIAEYIVGTDSEAGARQRARNVAVGLALGAMSVLFYAATIVRMGTTIASQPPAVVGSVPK